MSCHQARRRCLSSSILFCVSAICVGMCVYAGICIERVCVMMNNWLLLKVESVREKGAFHKGLSVCVSLRCESRSALSHTFISALKSIHRSVWYPSALSFLPIVCSRFSPPLDRALPIPLGTSLTAPFAHVDVVARILTKAINGSAIKEQKDGYDPSIYFHFFSISGLITNWNQHLSHIC